jgi:ferredoxin
MLRLGSGEEQARMVGDAGQAGDAGRVSDAGGDEQTKPGPGGLRVIVDRAACIGAAECVAAAPAAFGLDRTRRVTLLDPASVDAATLRRAAARCPADAVILEDEHGDQLYP